MPNIMGTEKFDTTKVAGSLPPSNISDAHCTVLPLAIPVSTVSKGLTPLVSMAWYTKNRKVATMASRSSFIH